MIEVIDATVRYRPEEAAALDAVSASFRPGEVVSLVGANGSGKSTLASLLCAMRLADTGSVRVDGVDPASSERARREVRRHVGFVRQHPADQLVSTSVFDEVAFGPRNLGCEPDEVRRRVERALGVVGLSDAVLRDTGSLSGGQQQLLALAGVLAMEPAYIVLDEATSMVDSSARPACRDLTSHLAHEIGLGVIQVTHDPLEILSSDRVMVISCGRIVMEGSPRSFLCEHAALWEATVADDPSVRATRACIAAGMPASAGVQPRQAVSWALDAFRGGSLPRRALKDVHDALVPAHRARALEAPGDGRLRLSEVDFAYSADEHALRGLSLAVSGGEVVLVAGPSGSGKSTLACIASGLYAPDRGEATLDGAVPRPGAVGIAFQRPEDQLFCESVRDELAFAPLNLGCPPEEAARRAERAASLVGLDHDLLERYPFDLSGGQARRVAIASVLALDAGAYVFDEPTAGLDAAGRRALHRVVRACAERGCAVIVISHDLDEWVAEADRVALMASGSIVWEGPAADIAHADDPFGRAGLRAPLSLELDRLVCTGLEGEVRQ